MTATLRLAKDLTMPLDAATETFGIFGVRGRGKTFTSAVFTEQMLGARIPVVVIDPTGAHWGLRSSADGKRPGFPITIVGGEHADVPLEKTAGKLLAELVAEKRVPLILDTSLLSKTAMRDFVTDFMETLYLRNRHPLHIIADECDMYIPQRTFPGIERLLGSMEDVVRRGRKKGLGITLISQRPASVHTTVRSQVGTLILLGLVGTHDIKAVDEWVNVHSDPDTAKRVKASLPSLPIGEAWVWSPQWLQILQRIKVDPRTTFDSSATPKVGETLISPAMWAKVDAAALSAEIAATIERASADDPKALRQQIRALERELAEAKRSRPEPEKIEVPVPVITEEMAARINESLADTVAAVQRTLAEGMANFKMPNLAVPKLKPIKVPPLHRPKTTPQVIASGRSTPQRRAATEPAADYSAKLGKGERKVLEVLAQWPDGRTHNELAFLAGYSASASTVGVILAKLRRAGYVADGQPIRPTADGLEAVGGAQPLPSGAELLDHWRNHPRMGEGGRRVLDVLIDAYPAALSNDELCDRTGYSPTASTVGVILSKLRKLGLVEKGARRADPGFMTHIGVGQ